VQAASEERRMTLLKKEREGYEEDRKSLRDV
jgi:hypothetical protein